MSHILKKMKKRAMGRIAHVSRSSEQLATIEKKSIVKESENIALLQIAMINSYVKERNF